MTVTVALPFTLTNGTTADANEVMANFNALVTGFTQAASAGANNDITALNGLLTPITPGQGGTNLFIGGVVGGTSSALVLTTTTPNTFTLTAGLTVTFIVASANPVGGGGATLQVGVLAAKTIVRATNAGTTGLTGGELVPGQRAFLTLDNTATNYILLNPANQVGGFGAHAGTLAITGTTADLGLIASHFCSIGAGTITSFGSSANVVEPRYLVKFTGATLLTYNATSLILPSTANITTAANDIAELVYLGSGNWQVINYTRATGVAVLPSIGSRVVNSWRAENDGASPLTQLDYSFSSAILVNSTNTVSLRVESVTGTIDITTGTTPGVPVLNGMDGNAAPVSNWGYIYVISDGTNTGCIISANANIPAFPSGFSSQFVARAGAIRFSGAGQMLRTVLKGDQADYFPVAGGNTTVFPSIAATSAVVWPAATSLSAFVPATAVRVRLVIAGVTNTNIAASSSSQTSGNTGFAAANPSEYARATVEQFSDTVELQLSTGIQFFLGATNTGTWQVSCVGWQDGVSAN